MMKKVSVKTQKGALNQKKVQVKKKNSKGRLKRNQVKL